MNKPKKILEFTQEDLKPINSFKLHSTLNPKVWKNYNLDPNIRKALFQIALKYIDDLDLEIKIEDIILTGSMANFNYSEYSDYDLHIIIDFSKIDKNIDLVKRLLDAEKKNWNETHDIVLKGYEVEIYCQDINEPHISSGLFSILRNKWVKKPTIKNFKIDYSLIKQKVEQLMNQIDELETNPNEEKIEKVFKKITNGRKEGLSEFGEFATGNLIFKTLRRNNYIKKLIDLKNREYDKHYESLVEKILNEGYEDFNKENILKAIEEIKEKCFVSPLSNDCILNDQSAIIEVKFFDDVLFISTVLSLKKGGGTNAMKLICNAADKYKVICGLSPVPFGNKMNMLNKSQLIKWYQSFGFKNKEIDYMERLPK